MSTPSASSALRADLVARLSELEELLAGGGADGAVVALDQQRVGRLSRMDAMQAQAMAGATDARRARERRRLKLALTRVDAGNYGACVDCDEAIAPERLRIDPAAERCVRCAEAVSD